MEFHWTFKDYLKPGTLPIYTRPVVPQEQLPQQFHDHDAMELAIVRGGTAIHIVQAAGKRHSVQISTGDVLLIPRTCFHGYNDSSSLSLFNIVYDPRQLPLHSFPYDPPRLLSAFFLSSDDKPMPEICVNPIMHLAPLKLADILKYCEELHKSLNSPLYPGGAFEAYAIFLRLMAALSASQYDLNSLSQDTEFALARAIHQMKRAFDKPLTLDELAKTANMSTRTFSRIFRQKLGVSPIQYLQQLRLERSKELLRDSSSDISAIAFQCGFSDSNYFSKLFRSRFKCTPRDYRKKAPGGNEGFPAGLSPRAQNPENGG